MSILSPSDDRDGKFDAGDNFGGTIRHSQTQPAAGLASSSPFAHPPEHSRRISPPIPAANMLLTPAPAGQRILPGQGFGGPITLPTMEAGHEADQAEIWDAASNSDDVSKRRQPCSFFLKTGNCAFGSECKFEHPLNQPATQYNSLGLPLRPGEPDCAYYVKNLHCGYGGSCKFHHAEPVIGWMQPMLSENMGMHPSMLGYSQMGGLGPAGLPSNYPLHPLMLQPPPHMQMAPQPGNLASSQQYATQMRHYMPLSVPSHLPHQRLLQMPLPLSRSPQLMHQPQVQHALAPAASSLGFQSIPQRASRREERIGESIPGFAYEPLRISRQSETGRARRRGRGRGASHSANSATPLGNKRLSSSNKSLDSRQPSLHANDADLTAETFSSLTLEAGRGRVE